MRQRGAHPWPSRIHRLSSLAARRVGVGLGSAAAAAAAGASAQKHQALVKISAGQVESAVFGRREARRFLHAL